MPRSQKSANPFYVLLVLAGIAFAITATAYGVMALEEVRARQQADAQQERHPLIDWMRRHGNTALLTELGFLAVFTIGAIATDDFWQRRAAAERKRKKQPAPESFAAQCPDDRFRFTVEKDSPPQS